VAKRLLACVMAERLHFEHLSRFVLINMANLALILRESKKHAALF